MDDLSVLIRSASGFALSLSTTADDPNQLVTVDAITTKHGTGFETAVLTLHRDPRERFDDLHLLMEVIITDAEGFVLHEGIITGLPPETGKVKIHSTGRYALLKSKSGFTEVYSDKDVGNWGGMPLNRRAALLAASYSPEDGGVEGGAIITKLAQPTWTAGSLPVTESWYTAPPGVSLGSVDVDWARSGSGVGTGGSNHDWRVRLATDDAGSSADDSGDLEASGPGSASVSASVGGRRFAFFQYFYSAAYGTDDSVDRAIHWTNVTVKGDHGLNTITPSEVVKNLIDRYGQGLAYTAESITDHTYEIGHLVFEAADGSEAIAKANAFANWNFHVWEGGICWYGPQPDLNAPQFILDVDDGDELDPDGQSVSDDFPVNGVEVFYSDVLTQRDERIGPDDDDRLADASDENPCNKESIDRWGKLDMSSPCTEDDAIQVGSVWLAEHIIPSRSGSGAATGNVLTADGQSVPARRIRSGDVIRYRHETIGREVYETTYQPTTGEVRLKFDDGAATLSAMLERIGVAIILAGGR